VAVLIKTRVFELCKGNYKNLSELAQAMGLSVSQVYRVREGKRSINQKFIVGAKKAFPDYRLDDLFYLKPESDFSDIIETVVTKDKY
jgi:transcriptional regulator with XRE-family HTH domain